MALPGDATNHTPLVRTDYSSIDIRKFVVDPSELNKTAVFPASSSTTGFSVNITRALTAKPNKMKNLHRRKRANEVMATIPQATAIGPVKSRPRYLDLFEAVTMREPRSQPFASSYCIETLNSGSGSGHERSNTGGGRGTESPGLGSEQVHRHMGYNEYLAQAFGFSRESTEKSTPEQEKLMKAGPSSLSGQSDTSTASMEVCFRMSAKEPLQMSAKERRPKIQLTIPRTRSHTYSVMPYQTSKERPSTRRHDTPNSVSPPSTTRQKIDSELPARLSIVSPLSVVEMPRPRRPFSKFSFEDITKTMSDSTPLLSKSASSDSSDMDDRSSNYSSRSSVSSLNSDSAVKPTEITRGSVAFSIMSPTAAGVFDSMPLTPPYPKHPRAMRSTTFLADKVTSFLADKVNRNKPLPPEPGAEPIRPLAFSRTSSMRSRGKAPPPLLVTRQSSVNLPRSRESQGMSLRSKYTPADLDALDDAFQRSSPPYLQPPIYTCQKSPTLSQAEMALEAHLGTINEDAPMNYDLLSLMHDPLQISRGPMQMEPSRKPPSLPQSQVSGEGSLDPRKKLQKKPSTHVVLQMRVGSQNSRKRISASLIGSSTKAHKILGRSCTGAPMERDGSTDAHWSSSESRRVSTNMSAEDSDSPESDVSSIQDAAFEEVRQRLELLSPKDDASQTFLAFHESIRVGESSVSHDVQKQDCSYPPTKIPQPSVSIPERHVFPRAKEPLEDPVLNQTPQGPPIEITTTSEDDIHPLHRRRRCDEMSVRSLGSIAVSEIPDIYASLPSPESPRQQSMTEDEVERMISADAAEQVLLRILENLDNLQDLFNTAHVSRGFYRTFKRHELPLMKNALFSMSPAAWELREMSPPYPGLEGIDNASPKLGYTPSLYLQHYMRDMYIMIALKSMILVHCKSFLRADTITALAGGETDRASQIDDAFCRVWTFCRLFGCGTNREDDIVGQMDWLRGGTLARQQRRKTSTVDMGADLDMDSITINAPVGFGKGNIGGLTAEDLYDMTEIWTCLGVLVRGLQGKRKEARDYGVFEKSNITPGNFEQEDGILGMCLISFSTQDNQLTLNRGMDVPPPYSGSTRRP